MTKEGVRKAGWNDETERRSFFRDCKCGSYFENPNIYIYNINNNNNKREREIPSNRKMFKLSCTGFIFVCKSFFATAPFNPKLSRPFLKKFYHCYFSYISPITTAILDAVSFGGGLLNGDA